MSKRKKPILRPTFTSDQKDVLIAALAALLDQYHGGAIMLNDDAVRAAYDGQGLTFTRALGKVRISTVAVASMAVRS